MIMGNCPVMALNAKINRNMLLNSDWIDQSAFIFAIRCAADFLLFDATTIRPHKHTPLFRIFGAALTKIMSIFCKAKFVYLQTWSWCCFRHSHEPPLWRCNAARYAAVQFLDPDFWLQRAKFWLILEFIFVYEHLYKNSLH